MSKSEELKKLAQQEDNDLKYMGIMKKAIREERNEEFYANWLSELYNSDKVISIKELPIQGKIEINTDEFGIVDFFPKANKVLRRNINKWVHPGLKWIKDNLIHKKDVS